MGVGGRGDLWSIVKEKALSLIRGSKDRATSDGVFYPEAKHFNNKLK